MKPIDEFKGLSPDSVVAVERRILSYKMPNHRHDYIEMSLVLEGYGKETVNGAAHELKPGTFSFLLPIHSHELAPNPDSTLKLYNLNFEMSVILESSIIDAAFSNLIYDHMEHPYFHFEGPQLERVLALFEDIETETNGQMPWMNQAVRADIIRILIEFSRAFGSRAEREPTDIWRVIQYIHEHYREPLSLSSVAGQFFYSEAHLSRQIKARTGHSFVSLLNEVRIRNACMYLRLGGSVERVAKFVGYTSGNSFTRVFKLFKGMLPSSYTKSVSALSLDEGYTPLPNSGTVWKAIYYIHLHYMEPITLQDLARKLKLEPEYLSEQLTRKFAQSFQELLNEVRVYYACNLLISADMAAGSIAAQTGFASEKAFFKQFKSLHGCTPGEYRQDYKAHSHD